MQTAKMFVPAVVLALLGLALVGKAANKTDADQGAQDPTDFPRPELAIRNSYSASPGALRMEEVATYHAKGDLDSTLAGYRALIERAGWTGGRISNSGTGKDRILLGDWATPNREAEVRFYVAKTGGTDLWVRVFTYKNRIPAQPAVAAIPPPNATAGPASSTLASKFGAAPVGPPPTNLLVRCVGDAATHEITWDATDWVSFDLFRDLDQESVTLAEGLTKKFFAEAALVGPNTKYRVVVKHKDGSIGSAVFVWADPPQPGQVMDLTATPAGTGAVRVNWRPPNFAYQFRVFATPGNSEGVLVKGNSATLTNLPLGKVTVRVAPCYKVAEGEELRFGNAWTEVGVYGDRFRVIVLGVECVHETLDNVLQTDGKHDEIFVGAYVGSIPPFVSILTTTTTSHIGPGPGGSVASQTSHLQAEASRLGHNTPPASSSNNHAANAEQYMEPIKIGCIRTKVMGDTNGFADRIQAGTASDHGGIQTGDFVPSSVITQAQPGVATSPDRFPLLVWEGDLLPDKDYIEIAPVIFEWDNADSDPWTQWCGWWSSAQGKKQLGLYSKNAFAGFGAFAGSFEGHNNNGETFRLDYGGTYMKDGTRPIGLSSERAEGLGYGRDLHYKPYGMMLGRKSIDASLGNRPAMVVIEDFNDDPSPGDLQGKYRLYLQIEHVLPK